MAFAAPFVPFVLSLPFGLYCNDRETALRRVHLYKDYVKHVPAVGRARGRFLNDKASISDFVSGQMFQTTLHVRSLHFIGNLFIKWKMNRKRTAHFLFV